MLAGFQIRWPEVDGFFPTPLPRKQKAGYMRWPDFPLLPGLRHVPDGCWDQQQNSQMCIGH